MDNDIDKYTAIELLAHEYIDIAFEGIETFRAKLYDTELPYVFSTLPDNPIESRMRVLEKEFWDLFIDFDAKIRKIDIKEEIYDRLLEQNLCDRMTIANMKSRYTHYILEEETRYRFV